MAEARKGRMALTVRQLVEDYLAHQLTRPVTRVSTRHHLTPLLAMFDRAIGEHFMGVRHAGLWQVARSPQEAVELATSLPRWDASIRKFAAL